MVEAGDVQGYIYKQYARLAIFDVLNCRMVKHVDGPRDTSCVSETHTREGVENRRYSPGNKMMVKESQRGIKPRSGLLLAQFHA